MNPIRLLPGFSPTDGRTTILEDLRSGKAGFLVRLGLSVAAAPIITAVFMFLFALIEMAGGNIDDEHIVVAVGISGAIWCGGLIWIWTGYRKFARVLKTIFAVLGTWTVVVPACVFVAESHFRGSELLIATFILTGISITIFAITTTIYQSMGGRALQTKSGTVTVNCPNCGYSLVGLGSCRCPECGSVFTIDEVIVAQDYEALRRRALPEYKASEDRTVIDEEPRHAIESDHESPDPTPPPDVRPGPA